MKTLDIQKTWNQSTYLSKVVFIMNNFRCSQEYAEKISKLEFNEIDKIEKSNIKKAFKLINK
jgi:hypothetical protein